MEKITRRAASTIMWGGLGASAQLAPSPSVTAGLTNGRVWLELGAHALKSAFLLGCQDGLFMGSLVLGSMVAGYEDYSKLPEPMKFPDLSRDEVVKELDLFYSEGANGPVPIVHALRYVSRKAKGDTPLQLQELAASLRRTWGH